jgi:SecD/SecF fusion protein
MVENVGRKVTLIVALLVAALALLLYNPLVHGRSPFPLGLDIAGGERLLYALDIEGARQQGVVGQTESDAEVLQQTISVMRQRCDAAGETEAVLRQVGTNRIEISLPRQTNRGAIVTAPLAEEVLDTGLPSVRLQAPEAVLANFPSTGLIQIDQERMRYRVRIKDVLEVSKRGEGGTDVTAHATGATVTLIDADEIKAALENLGDMRFLAVAVDGDLRRLGTDDSTVRERLRAWLAAPENAGAPISQFNELGRDKGGLPPGLAVFPRRPQAGEAVLPLAQRNPAEFLILVMPASGEDKFTGADLARVFPDNDRSGYPAVGFEMSAEAAPRFGDFTSALEKQQMAIVLNDEWVTAPVINQGLYGPSIIEGHFNLTERDALVTVLRSGSLKIKPDLINTETVGASIGDDYVKKNLWSGLVTFAVVAAFMIGYYRLLGLWASIALAVNLTMLLAAMVVTHSTLTLAGIGGIVLTMGMAVDANILIFERMREEQDKGRKPIQAAKDGFQHAMSAIVDGNLTTLITAIILMWIGTGTIRGFAITLTIGILTTLFSAIVVVQVLVHFHLKRGVDKFVMARWMANPTYKFMPKAKLAIAVSSLAIVAGLVGFALLPAQKKLGIDFLGGATVKVRTEEPMDVEALRETVKKLPGDLATAEVVDLPGSRTSDGRARVFRITFKSDPEKVAVETEDTEPEARFEQEVRLGLGAVLQKGPVQVRMPAEGSTQAEAVLYFQEAHAPEEVAAIAATAGMSDATAEARAGADDVLVVRGTPAAGTHPDALGAALQNAFLGKQDSTGHEFELTGPIEESSVVGAQVVGELRDSAIKALVLSSLLILLYIRVRFAEYSYGWGALLADFHDVLTTMVAVTACIALSVVGVHFIEIDLNLTLIAAFLTILGYSLNDTIVTFDRVRENLPRVKGTLREVVDLSINQTLSRTIVTGGTVLVSALIILVFNWGTGNALEGFAFALAFGCLTGTYSSIFIAGPVFVWLEERKLRKQGGNPSAPGRKPQPKPPVEGTV